MTIMCENLKHEICISLGKRKGRNHQRGKELFLLRFTSSIRCTHINHVGIFYCYRNNWWRIRHFVDEYYTTGYGSGNTWCFYHFLLTSSFFAVQNPKTRIKALETRKVAYWVTTFFCYIALLHLSFHSFRNWDDRWWKAPYKQVLFITIEPDYDTFFIETVWTLRFKLLLFWLLWYSKQFNSQTLTL